MSYTQRLLLLLVSFVAVISISGTKAQDASSPTWDPLNLWAEYPTMNNTHTCSSCYDRNGVNCIDYEFKSSVCCNHTIILPDGSISDKQERCMERFKYCSKGLTEDRYKALTCAQENCPIIKNERLGQVKNTNTEEYLDEKQTYEVELTNYNSAKYCKMVFNASSILNGKQTLKFTERTGRFANITAFQWPSVVNSQFQHGIQENGEVTEANVTKYLEAPTDWSIYLVFNMGPDPGSFKLETKNVWYDEADESKIENIWQPTNTYFQPWVSCEANQTPVESDQQKVSDGSLEDPNIETKGDIQNDDTKGPPNDATTPSVTKTDSSQVEGDVNKCYTAAKSGDIKPFQFIPQCCRGTSNGLDYDYWCIPTTFENVQIATSNYQGMVFDCPKRNRGNKEEQGAGASYLSFTSWSVVLFTITTYF